MQDDAEAKIFSLAEEILLNLKRTGANSAFNGINMSGTYERLAVRLLIKHELIVLRIPDNLMSVADLMPEGYKAIEIGVGKYISTIKAREQEQKHLTFEKLKIDVTNAKRIHKTYWWTFGFAITAFLISVWNLIKSLI